MTTPKRTGIQAESILLHVELHCFRITRKVDSDHIEVVDQEAHADKDWVRASKKILDSPELKRINSMDDELKSKWLQNRCLQSPFRNGLYLLPLDLLDQVIEHLEWFEEERRKAVRDFLKAYDSHIKAAQVNLGVLFRRADYPDQEEVERKFWMRWNLWDLSTPDKLSAMNRTLYKKELAKMQNIWAGAQDKIVMQLAEEMTALTSKLADRLKPNPDGTPKTFKATTVTKLQEYLSLVDARNLTRDGELKAACEKARKLIAGVDPSTIRDDDTLRQNLSRSFGQLTKSIEASIVTPRRGIVVSDLDD